MTAVVLAVLSAALLGVSDFSAARAARATPALTVTRTAVAASVALSPLVLVIDLGRPSGGDVAAALSSGVFMIVGLMLLYRGYAVARMGVVAPLSSVLLVAVPVMWDLRAGDRPSPTTAAGMAIGACAVLLTTVGSGSSAAGAPSRSAAALGLGSGAAFGIAFTLMSEVRVEAGLVPVALQRAAGLAVLVVAWTVRRDPLVAARGRPRRWALGAGVAGLAAIAALQAAFQRGSAGPVAVASSQFATMAVLLSVVFNRERMRWWQASGVGATAVAVALISVGSRG